jgi:hypothetical protein
MLRASAHNDPRYRGQTLNLRLQSVRRLCGLLVMPHLYSLRRYYMPQMQGLMDIFDRDWCDAWVWTPGGAGLFRIPRDRQYWATCYEVGPARNVRGFWRTMQGAHQTTLLQCHRLKFRCGLCMSGGGSH